MAYNKPAFIRLWKRSRTAQAVARRCGISPEAARSRAAYIRRCGTPLKHMPGGKARR